MPTNEDINTAPLRGKRYRPQQGWSASAWSWAADPESLRLSPSRRRTFHHKIQNTTAMARLFSDTFGEDGQPPEAVQHATTINSRTGQSVSSINVPHNNVSPPILTPVCSKALALVNVAGRRRRSRRNTTQRGAATAPLLHNTPEAEQKVRELLNCMCCCDNDDNIGRPYCPRRML